MQITEDQVNGIAKVLVEVAPIIALMNAAEQIERWDFTGDEPTPTIPTSRAAYDAYVVAAREHGLGVPTFEYWHDWQTNLLALRARQSEPEPLTVDGGGVYGHRRMIAESDAAFEDIRAEIEGTAPPSPVPTKAEEYRALARQHDKAAGQYRALADAEEWRCVICGAPIVAGQSAITLSQGIAHAGCYLAAMSRQ